MLLIIIWPPLFTLDLFDPKYRVSAHISWTERKSKYFHCPPDDVGLLNAKGVSRRIIETVTAVSI